MSILNFFKKKSEPFVINDDIGTFTKTKKDKLYRGKIKWLDVDDVFVSLYCDSDDSITANIALENLRNIVAKAEEWDEQIKKYIANNMSDKYGMVEIWGDTDTDDDISQITKEEFLSRISIGFIHIYPNGEIFFDYDMNGMFTDHGMGVDANISGEISSCGLWG